MHAFWLHDLLAKFMSAADRVQSIDEAFYDMRETPKCMLHAYVVHSQHILCRIIVQQDANLVAKMRLQASTEVGKHILHTAAASVPSSIIHTIVCCAFCVFCVLCHVFCVRASISANM